LRAEFIAEMFVMTTDVVCFLSSRRILVVFKIPRFLTTGTVSSSFSSFSILNVEAANDSSRALISSGRVTLAKSSS
jgi:hypothetical protein